MNHFYLLYIESFFFLKKTKKKNDDQIHIGSLEQYSYNGLYSHRHISIKVDYLLIICIYHLDIF